MNRTKAFGSSLGVTLLRDNPATPGNGLVAYITSAYATGFQAGDIRRCLLADVSAGVVSGSEKLTNGAFTSDLSGWTNNVGATWNAGAALLSATAGNSSLSQSFTTVVGQDYVIGFDFTGNTGNSLVRVGTSMGGFELGQTAMAGVTGFRFTATATTTWITLFVSYPGSSITGQWDNVSVREGVFDRSYKAKGVQVFGSLTKSQVGVGSQLVAYGPFSAANYLREAYSADLDFGTGAWRLGAWVSGITAAASTIAERSFSSGASITLGTDATGKITGTAFDGTTTRTVTSAAAYTGTGFVKAALEYTTSGALTLKVNGVQVAQTIGTPLLTLNNASAVFTVGNNFALTAPFPGSIALSKIGMTLPSDDASLWMYQQEAAMFRDGAQITLPDAGALVDLDYDPAEDKWKVASAANESAFTGLVRVSTAPVSAGSFTKVAHKSGIKLLARSTTNPGVDVTVPAQNLMAELLRRGEEAARLARLEEPFDWAGGFTATTVNGSALLTSVANLVIPTGATIVGAVVTGSGIPASTTVLAFSGTTIQLSAPCTAGASGVTVNFTDFTLPVGYEAKQVLSAGTGQQEGATKAFIRRYDGFREAIRFASAPGNTAWVELKARRIGQ